MCLTLPGDFTNNFINRNWRAIMKNSGYLFYDAFGEVVHMILSDAAKTVPYTDIFDDV
jgi:hypothetical protein